MWTKCKCGKFIEIDSLLIILAGLKTVPRYFIARNLMLHELHLKEILNITRKLILYKND